MSSSQYGRSKLLRGNPVRDFGTFRAQFAILEQGHQLQVVGFFDLRVVAYSRI